VEVIDNMVEPPTRADLAKTEKTAKRILTRTQDQEIRKFCKEFLSFATQIDKYVESVYPCFHKMETEVRERGCTMQLEKDGVWRLRDAESKILITGTTLKDLFVNLVLWDGDWIDEEFLEDCAVEEDGIFQPDRRKSRHNRDEDDV